jgi:hypothetical protein
MNIKLIDKNPSSSLLLVQRLTSYAQIYPDKNNFCELVFELPHDKYDRPRVVSYPKQENKEIICRERVSNTEKKLLQNKSNRDKCLSYEIKLDEDSEEFKSNDNRSSLAILPIIITPADSNCNAIYSKLNVARPKTADESLLSLSLNRIQNITSKEKNSANTEILRSNYAQSPSTIENHGCRKPHHDNLQFTSDSRSKRRLPVLVRFK